MRFDPNLSKGYAVVVAFSGSMASSNNGYNMELVQKINYCIFSVKELLGLHIREWQVSLWKVVSHHS